MGATFLSIWGSKKSCMDVLLLYTKLLKPFRRGLDVWDAWSFFKLLDLDAGGSVEILDRSAQAFWAFRPCVSTPLRLESSVPTESFVDACTFCMVRAVRAADVYETTSVLRLRSRNFLKVA